MSDRAAAPTQELTVALREALDSLAPVERDIFLMREAGGLNYQEISVACGLTIDAVRSRLHPPEEAVVQVTWQRLLENGTPANAAETSVQLTLLAGERVPLDTVAPLSQSPCQAITAAFEARYMARPFPSRTRTFGGGGVGAASGTASVGGTGRASAGAGATTGAGGVTREPRAETRLFDVELWPVHSAPDRQDEVVHQVLRVTDQGASFAFAPITIETPNGPASLQAYTEFTPTQVNSGFSARSAETAGRAA